MMRVWKYNSYDEYVDTQVKGNLTKYKSHSYVDNKIIGGIVQYVISNKLHPQFGLYHGIRRGFEQQYFIDWFKSQNINVSVLDTEISPTTTKFKNTIQWDFHEVKLKWINSIDLIYSNSFDHSYKPTECLKSWMSCLRKDGICVIEYSEICDTKSGITDSFGASLDEYKEFISKEYNILEILTNNGIKDFGKSYKGLRYYILISKKK